MCCLRDHRIERRDLLRLPLAALGVAGLSSRAGAQDAPLSPQAALRRLYDGNARFASGRAIGPNRSMDRVKAVSPKQAPFAAVLGCADSRVPVEIVFDQGFGDVFVTRVAGNVVDPTILGSLEFGSAVLGARVVYVLGHTGCGAVSAAMAGRPVPGQISALFQPLVPAVREGAGDLGRSIAANVRLQVELLANASPVLRERIQAGDLAVAGGVYDLESGVVTPVDVKGGRA